MFRKGAENKPWTSKLAVLVQGGKMQRPQDWRRVYQLPCTISHHGFLSKTVGDINNTPTYLMARCYLLHQDLGRRIMSP